MHNGEDKRSLHLWKILSVLLLISLLLLLDRWASRQAVHVELTIQNGQDVLAVDSLTLPLEITGRATQLQFAEADPVVHEYQIDGSDSTNNFTLDTRYFNSIASSPYYQFQAWLRDLDGLSQWRDLSIQDQTATVQTLAQPAHGTRFHLPPTDTLRIQVALQRPETPRTFSLTMADNSQFVITLNRNDRFILVKHIFTSGAEQELSRAFFPVDPLPFGAMVLLTIVRTLLWALLVLVFVSLAEGLLGVVWALWQRFRGSVTKPWEEEIPPEQHDHLQNGWMRWPIHIWQHLTAALHPIALIALCGSFVFVAWIAKTLYLGQPHIFDASAYLFAAKTYALGRLAAPAPPVPESFPGPFMILFEGRWFAQYPPGTALTLVPGIWLGLPWLVEPLLGTLALSGIGLIVARLANRRMATLVVLLGTLSPFYSYQAASYLSHTITLFYLVWGTCCTLYALQTRRRWLFFVGAGFFGMATLTRDQVGLLYVVLLSGGLLLLYRDTIRQFWRLWRVPIGYAALIFLLFQALGLAINASLTGSPLVMPRLLFFAGDRWGFGENIGFYGRHTLAAGLVNLDEQLTILATDLYGWPFYFTFVFLTIPFLLRRATVLDWFCLGSFVLMAALFTGYFYHGIYLGPRYLFETLPFLLILTARGILLLAELGQNIRYSVANQCMTRFGKQDPPSHPVRHQTSSKYRTLPNIAILLLGILLACNLFYYLPRHAQLYAGRSGMEASYPVKLTTVYEPPIQNALVVTTDALLYQMVLFPLNDPLLRGNILYAVMRNPQDLERLRQAFPGRTLYHLVIDNEGTAQYIQLADT